MARSTFNGTSGDNTIDTNANNGNVAVTGNAGNDLLIGSNFAGAVEADGFNDTIDGGDDNDTIKGGLGKDNLSGGTGDDVFVYDTAAELAAGEVIDGGDGTDSIRFTQAAGTLVLPAGSTIVGIERIELVNSASVDASARSEGFTIDGSAQANTVTGSSGVDSISTSDGTDVINWAIGQGADSVDGGLGSDTLAIQGSADADALTISATTVTGLASVTGVETLDIDLGNGSDTVVVSAVTTGATSIVLDGGAGTDTLDVSGFGAGVNAVFGGAVTGTTLGGTSLTATGFEVIKGTASADVFTGDAGANTAEGGGGDDSFTGNGGNDSFIGGSGTDTAVYDGTVGDYAVTFDAFGVVTVSDTRAAPLNGTDTLTGVERLDIGGTIIDLTLAARLYAADGTSLLGTYATIQAAVDAANAAGDPNVIEIASGSYAENLTITSGVTLKAAAGASVSLSPTSGTAVTIAGNLAGANVTFQNIAISGGGAAATGFDVRPNARVGTLTLDNVSVTGFTTFGLYASDNGQPALTPALANLIVKDSDFAANGTGGLNGAGNIKLFGFSGNANFTNLDINGAAAVTPEGQRPDNAIEIIGQIVNEGSANPPNDSVPNIGTVVFNDVVVTGAFHKNPVALFHFNQLDGLAITSLDLSNATSSWGPVFNIDGVRETSIDASAYGLVLPTTPGIAIELQGEKVGQTAAGLVSTITGTASADRINGKGGDDILNGRGGNDELNGGDGNDTLNGGDGSDTLTGGAGRDTIIGDTDVFDAATGGADIITDSDGVNRVTAGSGDDQVTITYATGFTGFNNGSHLLGNAGNDTINLTFNGQNLDLTNIGGDNSSSRDFDEPTLPATQADGNDTITLGGNWTGMLHVNLSGGDDTFTNNGSGQVQVSGGAGADSITGGSANDVLAGGSGSDAIIGGSGIDQARYATLPAAAAVAWDGTKWTVTSGTDSDTLTGVEQITNLSGTGARILLVGGGSEYATIQQAVDAAASGDTIMVAGGDYAGDVTIGGGKAISIVGSGTPPAKITGQITASGTLAGTLSFQNLVIDAAGKEYGIFANHNASGFSGSIALTGVTISNSVQNGFAYIRDGNGVTPSLGDTIGSIIISGSAFSNNGVGPGAGGRGDVLVFGFNQTLDITNSTFSGNFNNTTVLTQKAIQLRGIETPGDTPGVGGYDPAVKLNLDGVSVTGSYQQDAIAIYRIASFTTLGVNNVTLNGSAPWGGVNFDSVGGTVDLSGVSGSNSAPGAPLTVLQGLASNDSFTGSAGADVLLGRDGADIQNGGDGNDLFTVTAAAQYGAGDMIMGGAGTDTLRIATNTVVTLSAVDAELSGIEIIELVGTSGVVATGQTEGFTINGSSSANSITGGAGNDIITGGQGVDTIDGGAGDDSFIWNDGDGADIISGGTNTSVGDTLTVGLTAAADTLTINGGSLSGTGPASVSGVETVGINMLGGADSLTIDATTAGTLYRVDGGEEAIDNNSVVDSLVLNLTSGSDSATLANNGGRAEFNIGGGAMEVSAKDFETITINAGADNDSITVGGAGSAGDLASAGVSANTVIVNLGAGNDSFSATGTNVSLDVRGDAGDDDITGGDLADTLQGGADADIFRDSLGNDTIYGGAVGADDANTTIDTAVYAAGSVIGWNGTAWTVTSASGIDTLNGIEKLTIGSQSYWLVDGTATGGFTGLNEAIGSSAVMAGDTILVAPVTLTENVNFSKSVTVLGWQRGVDGDAGGSRDPAAGLGETTLIGRHDITTSAPVTIDGMRFLNTAATTNGGSSDPTLFVAAGGTGAGHVITNSIFWSLVSGAAADDRAISHGPLASGKITISDNLISGTSASGFGGASWGRGIWSDGSGVTLTIEGNTFQYTRTALNLDNPGSTVTVANNAFVTTGTALSLGATTGSPINWITGNSFTGVGTEYNFRGVGGAVEFDASSSASTHVDGGVAAPPANPVVILGGNFGDTITGTSGADYIAGDDSTTSSSTGGLNFGAGTSFDDANTLSGGAGSDIILGSSGADIIDGGADQDLLFGGGANDVFTGGAGNDAIYGGSTTSLGAIVHTDAGTADKAVYADARANYSVVGSPAGFMTSFSSVTDSNTTSFGDEGTDSLFGIEVLEFGGGLILDLNQPVQLFDTDGTTLIGTFASINAAQNAAVGGQTIRVNGAGGPGVTPYSGNEDVVLTKGVILQGFGTVTVASIRVEGGAAGQNLVIDNIDVAATLQGSAISVADAASYDSITVRNGSVTGGVDHGFFIGAATGVGAVTLADMAFSGNATGGATGRGNVTFFDYDNGNITLARVTVDATGGTPQNGIQINGNGGPMGTVTFDDVNVTGAFSSTGVAIRDYSTNGLVFNTTGTPDALVVNVTGGTAYAGLQVTFAGANAVDLDLSTAGAVTVTNGSSNINRRDIQIDGSTGNNVLVGDASNDVLIGSGGNDTLNGAGGNDAIIYYTGTGNDVVDGGGESAGGGDALLVFGSAGDNTVVFDSINKMTVDGGSITHSGVELFVIDAKQQQLTAAPVVDAGTGDTLDLSAASTAVQINLNNPVGTFPAVAANVTGGLGAYVAYDFENAVGGAGGDVIIGSDEANTITGGAGSDNMTGNAGDDIFVITSNADHTNAETIDGGVNSVGPFTPSNRGDSIRYTEAGGTLLVGAVAGISAAANARVTGIETIELVNAASVDASSQSEGFQILGSAEANRIRGGQGVDTVLAGDGDDIVDYLIGNGADVVDGQAGRDTLNVNGTNAANVIVMNGTTVDGLASVSNVEVVNINLLNGGDTMNVDAYLTGADTIAISGGTGTDLLSFAGDSVTGGVNADLSAGTVSGVTGQGVGETLTVSNFENLTGSAGADTLIGSTFANIINGGNGADIIDARGGTDTVNAGDGNDVIRITNLADYDRGSTFLGFPLGDGDEMNGGSGNDTLEIDVTGVLALGYSDAETADIEVIELRNGSGLDASTQTEGFIINGSSQANDVTGSQGADTISLGAGNDTVNGNDGDDTITGGAGNDSIRGGAGTDKAVYSGNWADYDVYFDPITGEVTVRDERALTPDGTDQVLVVGADRVENFQFADGVLTASELINRAPVLNPVATVATLDENIGQAAPAWSFNAKQLLADPNAFDTHRFSLTNDAGGRFQIDASTGVVTLAAWALINFEANASHSFTVKVEDAGGLFDIESYTVSINDLNEAPVITSVPQGGLVVEDEGAATPAFSVGPQTAVGQVTAADVDAGATVSYQIWDGTAWTTATSGIVTVVNPSYGTLSLNAATGAWSFVLDNANPAVQALGGQGNAVGQASFFVRATDGTLSTAATPLNATPIVVLIQGINDAPVAVSASSSAIEDAGAVTIPLSLLISDNENSDAQLNLTASVPAEQGLVTVSGQSLVFTPAANFNGLATITYSVIDGDGAQSAPATITVNVTPENDAPVVTSLPQVGVVVEDGSAGAETVASGTLAASDVDGGPVSWQYFDGAAWVAAPAGPITSPYGAFTLNGATGAWTFTLDNSLATTDSLGAEGNLLGQTSLQVRATDGTLFSAPTVIAVGIGGTNDAPRQGTLPTVTLSEDGPAATINILGSFTDAEGKPLSIASAASANGTVVIDGGNVVFTPAANYNGPATITFSVTDGDRVTTSSLAFTIDAVNDAPVVISGIEDRMVVESRSFSFAVPAATFADVDAGQALTLSATLSNGGALPSWLSFDAATGTFTGTAPANYADGPISVRVTASDNGPGSLSVSDDFVLSVAPVNDAPAVPTLAASVTNEDAAPIILNLLAGVTDADGPAVPTVASFDVAASNGANVAASLDPATGALTINPAQFNALAAGQQVVLTVNYVVTDGDAVVNKTTSVTVNGVNDAPVISAALTGQVDLLQGTVGARGLTIGTFTATDADGEPLTFTVNDARFEVVATVAPGVYELKAKPNAVFSTFDVGLAIEVSASDSAGPVTRTFNLGDALSPNATFGVAENLPANTVVGTVVAPGGLTNPSFALATANNQFAINAVTGEITTLVPFNFEATSQYVFDVVITGDQGSINDTQIINVQDQQNVVNGTINPDTLAGTVQEDSLFGLASNDTLSGGAMDDLLYGGTGDDTLQGGAGADLLDGGAGTRDLASYAGSSGPVTLNIGAQSATGGDATGDTLVGIEGGIGSDFADNFTGSAGADLFFLGAGADVANGLGGDDTINGEAGQDTILGGAGNDVLTGGADNDVIYGGDDNDWLYGDAGNDVLLGENGNDMLYDGDGLDTLSGGNGNDLLVAAGGDDVLLGDAGDDVLYAGSGFDYLVGGLGNDTLYASAAGTTQMYGSEGNDLIYGNANNDYMQGDSDNDILFGLNGADTLVGGSGSDSLSGNGGSDYLIGGAGVDGFYFLDNINGGDVDQIGDFQAATDLIFLTSTLSGSVTIGDSAIGAYISANTSGGLWAVYISGATASQVQTQIVYL